LCENVFAHNEHFRLSQEWAEDQMILLVEKDQLGLITRQCATQPARALHPAKTAANNDDTMLFPPAQCFLTSGARVGADGRFPPFPRDNTMKFGAESGAKAFHIVKISWPTHH
jgi:hypothetical protein